MQGEAGPAAAAGIVGWLRAEGRASHFFLDHFALDTYADRGHVAALLSSVCVCLRLQLSCLCCLLCPALLCVVLCCLCVCCACVFFVSVCEQSKGQGAAGRRRGAQFKADSWGIAGLFQGRGAWRARAEDRRVQTRVRDLDGDGRLHLQTIALRDGRDHLGL